MTTGASWEAQLIAALVAAAFGAAASPLTLLFDARLRPLERFVADACAVVAVGALFLLSAEAGAKGQLTLYCAVCYFFALGISRRLLLVAVAALKARFPNAFSKKKKKRKVRRADKKPSDYPAPVSSRYNRRQAERRISASRREKARKAIPRRRADGWG